MKCVIHHREEIQLLYLCMFTFVKLTNCLCSEQLCSELILESFPVGAKFSSREKLDNVGNVRSFAFLFRAMYSKY